jgi:L-rhamnono-1,4-lactonase
MSWADEPLSELSFLRRIVEGELGPDVGFEAGDGRLMSGIVAWAPLDRGLTAFRQYIHVAELHAGKATWAKVCGFRFLLQGITDRAAFRDLVEDQKTVNTLREFASSSWAFDVGVDQRQVGTWQLEMVADLIERVHDGLPVERKVVFVLSKYPTPVPILRHTT